MQQRGIQQMTRAEVEAIAGMDADGSSSAQTQYGCAKDVKPGRLRGLPIARSAPSVARGRPPGLIRHHKASSVPSGPSDIPFQDPSDIICGIETPPQRSPVGRL
jgi:hypothetical protein